MEWVYKTLEGELDGANCQTVLPERMTQREAAVDAVRKIGLRQVREMDMSIFGGMKKEAQMFCKRLVELRRQQFPELK